MIENSFEEKYLALLDEHNALKDLYLQAVKENNLLKDRLSAFKIEVSENALKTKDVGISFPYPDPNSYFGDKIAFIKFEDKYLKFSENKFVLEDSKECDECAFEFIYRPKTKNLFLRTGKEKAFITLSKNITDFETVKDGNQRGRFLLKYNNGCFEIYSKAFENYFLAVRKDKINFTNEGEPSKFLILQIN